MNFILIRHGETVANQQFLTKDRILIGALESPLTQLNEQGRRQALSCREALRGVAIDQVWSSDLGRAQETAHLIFDPLPIHLDADLRERSLGSLEGKKAQEVLNDPILSQFLVDPDHDSLALCRCKKVPDGESLEEVEGRARKFLSRFDFTEKKTIAIVSHFHFLRILILENRIWDRSCFQMEIQNACPRRISVRSDQPGTSAKRLF